MRLYFVGIGGEGMCGTAKLALDNGHIVSGSELAPKIGLSELENLGAVIFREHRSENVSGADMVIRSSAFLLTMLRF